MSNTSESQNGMSTCANCGKGKESSIDLKSCAACKLVKYCSRDCQIAHRPQHKKECKKRAAEIHDEKLFEEPPLQEDCPICMIRLPTLDTGRTYMACCGKSICSGCVHGFQSRVTKKEHDVCPFCRTPAPATNEEIVKRNEKRIDMNDSVGMLSIGCMYRDGDCGLPQDHAKALEFWHRAGELGCAEAHYSIGIAYYIGRGVERDKKRAVHYFELAAMEGDVEARHNLGIEEENGGDINRALKHWMISARFGSTDSLNSIKLMNKNGDATKNDHDKAIKAYQAFIDEIKSDQRDKAAAVHDNRYY